MISTCIIYNPNFYVQCFHRDGELGQVMKQETDISVNENHRGVEPERYSLCWYEHSIIGKHAMYH